MRKCLQIDLLLVLLLGLWGCASPPAATSRPDPTASANASFTGDYALYTPTPANHVYTLGAQRFADLLKQRTNGRITITVFPDGRLAKGEREALEGLQQGTIDLYAGSTGVVGNFAESFLVLDLPFLFRDSPHADKVLDGALGQALLGDLDSAQIKGLALWENGFRNLTNSVRPVRAPEDVKALKVRTMENQVHVEAWRALGGAPTPMAWGEVYGALQRREIDGQENPIAVIYSSRIYEVQKHLTLTRHVYSPALIAMSASRFRQMPKADQELFVKTADEVTSYQRQLGRDQEAQWIRELKQKGMEVVESVDTASWQAAMKPVFDKYADRFGERIKTIVDTRP